MLDFIDPAHHEYFILCYMVFLYIVLSMIYKVVLLELFGCHALFLSNFQPNFSYWQLECLLEHNLWMNVTVSH